ILTGKGNNGGDGYVVARLAALDRLKVTLCNFCASEKLKGDAKVAFDKLPRSGLSLLEWPDIQLGEYDLVVDAMLGTGIKGNLRAPFDRVIKLINQADIPVIAVDIPSGLEADTGNVSSGAVQATMTITFIGHKRGLYTGEAANYRGVVKLADLGIPETCFQSHEFNVVAENWKSVSHKIKPRSLTSHKGNFGRCLIIGGATGMVGAAILASSAAARSGSGLTSAWLENGAESLVSHTPEVMAKNQNAGETTDIQIEGVNSLVVGPGLGRSSWATDWMEFIARSQRAKMTNKIFDADALNWLALNPNKDPLRILTPHPGEAGRLLGISTQEVNQNRFEAAQNIAVRYGGICVLKGAGTIICDASGMLIVCPVGNPGMASGGMGDVLSGIIGAFIAQGFSLLQAAILGVCAHGEAAERVAGPRQLYRGMLASDLVSQLPQLVNP
ncbi:MAG: NAD(P)H-hydrate dehydratase, partial [Kangiellaceae bacterium]|nr:NAD(P)H-hydrate dehydratase [Kangiellaceae bacterium]